ncbi:MAG: hypothetical protein M1480_04805 [Bacteroidetes bacterium]|nr:hypothetical protein [Bacteroidota bacterium]
MKIILSFCLFCFFSILIYSQTKSIELIDDLNFSNGIGLEGVNSADKSIIDTLYPFGKGNARISWKLAQWFSRYNLKGTIPKKINKEVIYSNQGKTISFMPIKGSTQIDMEVIGSKEYVFPRKEGEAWPHILLEQTFKNQVGLNNIKTLNFKIDARLMFSKNLMNSLSYNPSLHTSQFSIYLVVQNLNKKSSDYKDYFWFGLHLYDYRWRTIQEYKEVDKGKLDATKKFIYCPASSDIYAGSFQNMYWIDISKDLYPIIKHAFNTAQERGYLKGSSVNDMHITGMNIGWEVTGTFDCGFRYKDLRLTATTKN